MATLSFKRHCKKNYWITYPNLTFWAMNYHPHVTQTSDGLTRVGSAIYGLGLENFP